LAYLLHIETATDTCSVCLSSDDTIIDVIETHNSRSHASLLSKFIEEIIIKNKIQYSSLSAISVSCGPGSYTGLRIGVSAAKGYCYALQIPLIAIPTLKSMASQVINHNQNALLCPMIDARRMEVYTALYHSDGSTIVEEEAIIIDEHFRKNHLINQSVCFFGNGAFKLPDNIKNNHHTIVIEDFKISSTGLVKLAYIDFSNQIFQDVAYFEPFYLKDFFSQPAKKQP
jgi:tRNA threonylcarbamoyladenosine biosynthesis protein TsaB